MATIKTRFTTMLGVKYPVMQEGLGPYKTIHLAVAVSNAGGLGTVSIPGISEIPEVGAAKLRGYIEQACALTDLPFPLGPTSTATSGHLVRPTSLQLKTTKSRSDYA